MKEWKIKQEIYHRLNTDFTDSAENFDIEINDNIIDNAVRYFQTNNIGWIWPAKSYMVGICYAKWLSEDFGGDPMDYLNDPSLLYNNDPYFKPYNNDSFTYDTIFEKIGGWGFNPNNGVVPEVRHYYNLEFLYE